MSQIAKASKATHKKAAYQKKQEKGGKKVMEWIFGVLVLLAIVLIFFYISSMYQNSRGAGWNTRHLLGFSCITPGIFLMSGVIT